MTSNIEVRGDETLPPNHPPLPAATPPHPTGDANARRPDQQIAAQHPARAGKTNLTVSIPESVRGKWASAILAISTGGSEAVHKVAIGGQLALGNNLKLHLVHFLPAYSSDFRTVTSSSDEEINPAVQIQLTSDGKVIAEGWVFRNLPEFNSFKSEQIRVRLVSAERTDKK